MSETINNPEINNTDKPEKLVVNKKSQTIAQKFAAYISVLVFITVIFMAIYFLAGAFLFNRLMYEQKQAVQNFSNSLIESYKDDLSKSSYSRFNKILNFISIKGEPIHVYITQPDGKVKYASSNINKQLIDNLKNVSSKEYKFILPNKDIAIITTFDSYTSFARNIFSGFFIIGFISMLLGIISAPVLAKIVTRPIQNLYVGVKEFSKRNLSYRIDVKSDDEIGKLAESFNQMAEELDSSYKFLEEKVKERTQELEEKNIELEKAYKNIQEAQVKLVHSEKMSSLGQLVAGIAHELNNPINFVYGNLDHLKNYTNDMQNLISKYEDFKEELPENHKNELEKIKEEIEYDYLVEDLNDLLKSCKDGAERSCQIIMNLKNFSRLDEAQIKEVDIHEGIDSTLNILHYKYKNSIDIVKNYDKDLPKITCYAGQLNQVFMNILSNAAQAITNKGTVTITTKKQGDYAVLTFSDTGNGIPEELLSKIFDPFFTTKEIGKGTGLGLSISYGIIDKHNGTISVESKIGVGTTFTIKLPINWQN